MTHVLVVDDDCDIRLLTRLLLEWAGHTVVDADDGETALTMLTDTDDVEVVLLDIGLPGMSGWDVMAEMRERGLLAEVRVIVFSAHIGPREHVRAAMEGALDYLPKPFTEDGLLATIS
jgi:CheY-like chemotaxis protein